MVTKNKKSPVVMWTSEWKAIGERLLADKFNRPIKKPNFVAVGSVNKDWRGFKK